MWTDEFATKPVFTDSYIVFVSGRKSVGDTYLNYIYSRVPTAEGKGIKNFFCDESDAISYKQAKDLFTHNGYYNFHGEDVMTLCVAPHRRFYEALSGTVGGRENAFRDVIREAIRKFLLEQKILVNWVAAIDTNAEKPLTRIIISKGAFCLETEKPKILKRLFPRTAFNRAEPEWKNLSQIEKSFTEMFFDRAAQDENFENQKVKLMRLSSEFNVELPLSYYALSLY
jgi:hypothetical protein